MVAMPVQGPPHGGQAITYITPASNDTAPTGANIGLLIKSPSAAITVSIPLPNVDGLTVGPRVVSVGSGSDWLIPLPDNVYGPGPVILTYSGTLAAVLAAVIRAAG